MAKCDGYSGFTKDTAENLLLDAGAFFIDFDIEKDDFESAVEDGKLLGATRGGGNFSAEPEIRDIVISGVRGAAKGLSVIDVWKISITLNDMVIYHVIN